MVAVSIVQTLGSRFHPFIVLPSKICVMPGGIGKMPASGSDALLPESRSVIAPPSSPLLELPELPLELELPATPLELELLLEGLPLLELPELPLELLEPLSPEELPELPLELPEPLAAPLDDPLEPALSGEPELEHPRRGYETSRH